jgi:biotin carboxylase
MRTLWVVSGGVEAVPGIRRARELGLRVVVSDGSPRAPGFALAHDRVLASTYDAEATREAALRYARERGPVDGILSIAADVPVTVARVAQALGLPGISVASAALSADKLAQKRRLAEDGVAVPWFAPVEDLAGLRTLYAKEGPPLVLKPVDGRGARGVLRLTGDLDLALAFELSRRESPSGRLLLERFFPGPQLSTESLVIEGVAYTPGFADRNYELLERCAPYLIENGGTLPSRLPAKVLAEVAALLQRAAESLGVRDGVLKGDLVIHEGRPHVIEVATRLSGGYLCSHEIPLSTGVDFVGAAIRQALGERVDPAELVPRFARGVCQRCLLLPPGRVAAIEGVAEVRARPEVALLDLRIAVGDRVPPLTSHAARSGLLVATGADAAAAEKNALAALAALRVRVEES